MRSATRHSSRLALWVLLLVVVTGLWSTSIFVQPARSAPVVPSCSNNTVVWTGTQLYSPGTFCLVSYSDLMIFQTDGNLVWYVNNVAEWSSGTYGTGQTLALQGDGNVVIYSTSGTALYASSWGSISAKFTTPDLEKDLGIFWGQHSHSVNHRTGAQGGYGTPSALSGLEYMDWGAEGANCTVENRLVFLRFPARSLPAGQFCWSTDNGTLVFQSDGNLVEYVGGTPRWSSGTWGRGARLAIQLDGNIVIYNASGAPIWALSWQVKGWSPRDLTHNNGWIYVQIAPTHQIQLGVYDNMHIQAINWTV
jgi:hypothetical protein